jgi:hypothetical protein
MPEIIRQYTSPELHVIAYTAGMIDGEGSITVNDNRTQVAVFQSAKNSGETLCTWLRDHWGFGRVRSHTGDSRGWVRGVFNTMWCWDVAAKRDALFLLQTTLPYLIVKHDHAAASIAELRSRISDTQRGLPWSDAEDAYIKAHAGKLTARVIAEHLRRSRASIHWRMEKLGVNTGRGSFNQIGRTKQRAR